MPNRGAAVPHLRENLTRERRDRDPFRYYEQVEVLGVGSMGSVAKVRKKPKCLGGSARPHNVRHRNFPKRIVLRVMRNISSGRRRRGSLDSDHSEDSDLGAHSRSTRHSAISTDTNYEVYYALKSIKLDRVKGNGFVDELRNEVEILKKLDHPYIVKAIETFDHKRQLYMVLELCSGGDLYTRDPYTEDQAARIVRMILSAVKHMHDVNIMHRDIKYENIMFASDSPSSEVKIIDFGLSKKYGKEERLKEGCGTIYTMVPEVLHGEYDEEADIWSIGVVAYMLLSSRMPFFGTKRSDVMQKIERGDYDFKGRRFKNVSQQAKTFVSELLQVDPEERPTAAEARQSLWLNKSTAATVMYPTDEDCAKVLSALQNYVNYSMLKRLALMVVAHKSTSQEIGFLRKVFQKITKGHEERTGAITKSQLHAAMEKHGYTEEEVDTLFSKMDIDASGFVQWTEFLAATIEAHGPISEERLAEAFDRLDDNDTGFISSRNLCDFLDDVISEDIIEKMIAEADINKDRKISYGEFLGLWSEDFEPAAQTTISSPSGRSVKYDGIQKSEAAPLNSNDASISHGDHSEENPSVVISQGVNKSGGWSAAADAWDDAGMM